MEKCEPTRNKRVGAAEVQKCEACEAKAGIEEAICKNISLAKLAFVVIIGTSNKLLLTFWLNFHFVNYFMWR